MARATDWKESVLSDLRVGDVSDVVVRSIADLKTEKKRLVDSILFDGLDILRCYEGSFRFSFKDRPSILLKKGETLIIYPRHIVTIDALEKTNRIVYGIFEGWDVVDYFDSLGFFDCAKGRTEAHYDSIEELRNQLEEGKKRRPEDNRHCLSLLTDILTSQAAELRKHGDPLVFDAVKYIHKNLRERVVHLKPLCEQLGISRVHLHRLFQKAGLGSPSDFMREMQMRYARDLLENTRLNFSEIATQTGFLSSAHFTTFVKRMTGHTPSQIRQGGLDG